MTSAAPERFSPDLLVRQPERLTAQFSLTRCSRLTELLADGAGTLSAEFELRRHGKHVAVAGQLGTTYQLECQRCLAVYTHQVSSEFEFVLVPDEATAQALDEELDPVILDEDGMIDLVRLFEDELILLVPSVPKHETPAECEFAVEVTIDENFTEVADSASSDKGDKRNTPEENAFSVLKNLQF